MMFSAQAKDIYSLEIKDLDGYVPERPDLFCIQVRLIVGPRGEEGEESFDVQVCTPAWIAQLCERDGFVVGRHFLVVGSYDWPRIRGVLTDLVGKCAGQTWREVAEKVGRIGYWEFEDYKPEGD